MLKEVMGDILRTTAEMVAHGVAPNDGYANGLALSLRQQWPAMYKDFRHYCQTLTPKTGELCAWAGAGGLDWKDVKPLIEKHLGYLPIPVYVYATYQPDVQAKEG